MRILVAGGSGFVGTALVDELTARGHDLTVLARTPEDAVLPASVARVALDLTDAGRGELMDALDGHDAVVNLVALSPLFVPPGGAEMHDAVHRGGTESLVAAAAAADVPRFVQVSALGADPDGPTHYIRAKGEAERVVRDSELEWTVARPSVVFGDGGEFVDFTRLLTTPYVTALPGGGKTGFQPIWVGDFAPILADCVEDDRHVGETYELGGPEVLTLAEVARQVYAARGRPLRVVPVPMPLARLGLTLAGAVPGVPLGPDQYRSLRFDNTVDGGDPSANDVTDFDVDPDDLRTLRAYLADEIGGDGDGADDDGGTGDAGGAAVADEAGADDDRTAESGASSAVTDGGAGDGDGGDGVDVDGRVAYVGGDGRERERSLLTSRGTLALFAFLALSRFVPEVAATTFGVDLYAWGLIVLYIPSYLVTMVTYDGLLGLEHVTYAIQVVVPGEWAFAWDAGLLVTFYLFSVVAVGVGRVVRRLVGSGRDRDGSGWVENR